METGHREEVEKRNGKRLSRGINEEKWKKGNRKERTKRKRGKVYHEEVTMRNGKKVIARK